jgi:hypothetical protein
LNGIGILIQLRDQRIFEGQYPGFSLLSAKVSNFPKMSRRKYCNITVPPSNILEDDVLYLYQSLKCGGTENPEYNILFDLIKY